MNDKKLNLTRWALNHKTLMYYFMIVIMLAGVLSYVRLGRMEDPDFTIRQMIVQVNWPGATARQIEEQVTDKIEKKLQETPGLDYLKSFSTPGQSIIYVVLKDDAVTESQVRPIWRDVRNMVNDIKHTLPQGVVGPFFNDRFDDVFGCVFALSGDGYSYEELREQGERIRRSFLGIPNVKKVELIGVQNEKIFVEMQTTKLAQLGLSPTDIMAVLQGQNSMVPAGMLDMQTDNMYLRVSGIFNNIDDLKSIPIRANGRTLRLDDIATIRRAYSDPPDAKFYYNGQPAIGIALSMEKGGNIINLGQNLDGMVDKLRPQLPLGLELNTVLNQPTIVKDSINEFVSSLAEAVIIVLLVSFVSLGVRSGVVVALCIPLVIAATFVCMYFLNIDLHKISLGALIISLGLLVDDAIIAIEMMIVKLEQGWSRFDAACHAYTVTSIPMLTGTLITCAGFIPVGFSKGSASEYVGSLFSVITISLIISWFVSVLVTPLFGYSLIPSVSQNTQSHHEMYNTKFYVMFRKILVKFLQNRKTVLWSTLAVFILSLGMLKFVKQEFFPPSTRPEVIVEMRLPQGASIKASDEIVQRFAKYWEADERIVNFTANTGKGAPRFVLPFDPVMPDTAYSQFVIIAKKLEDRDQIASKAKEILAADFPEVMGNVKIITSGLNSPYPVMLRVSGYEHEKVREIAAQVQNAMAVDPNLLNIHQNWNEKSKVLRLDIDQDKARALGIDTQGLSSNLQALVSGAAVSEFREGDRTIAIVFRLDQQDTQSFEQIKTLNIYTGYKKFVPLEQIAKISYAAEEGLIWRRNLQPTITVQAATNGLVMGDTATKQVYERLADVRANLPPGYSISIDGTLENSQKAMGWLLQPVPMMFFLIVTLLMLQLQNFSKTLLTLASAPLGIIGVSLGLLITGSPMGFVVQLGILALFGIIMRNTVILIDQIDLHLQAGETLTDAIINATITRFRPIMLTAAAATLAMIPLMRSLFWGPMAVAIASGLTAATILTLLVLPVMYAAWYKAAKPKA